MTQRCLLQRYRIIMTAAAAAPCEVIKSEHDNKQYRHLVLPNGLSALLIHDPATHLGAC
jgi:secreted Zn-dependent insulinase-like peptidase